MPVFQNFYCKSESTDKTGNYLIDIYSIVEIGRMGGYTPKEVRLCNGNIYYFDEDNYQKLLEAMDREGIKMYDADGFLIK
ncbi:MAG: hypothetical protein K2M06_06990 [Muribaculaceae bacterium]|nr:hypothetical protein [Muribaculaceae bacterium]